jgi:RimJ/RimL family protein N-acetyltransferase
MYVNYGIGIRPVEARDLESIRLLRNDDSTFSQLTFAEMITPAQQEAWFDALGTARDRAYFTVVTVKHDPDHPILSEGEFIGMIRTTEIDRINRSICIGADVIPAMRGRGYGTKIYKALLKYLFDDLAFHKCFLMVIETNLVARRLYEGVGFRYDGIHRQAIWRDGAWRDYLILSILEDEYRASK